MYRAYTYLDFATTEVQNTLFRISDNLCLQIATFKARDISRDKRYVVSALWLFMWQIKWLRINKIVFHRSNLVNLVATISI